MIKLLTLTAIILLSSSSLNAQSKSETESWIIEKINEFQSSEGTANFYYTISFVDENMVVITDAVYNWDDGTTSGFSYTRYIPVKNLMKLSFSEDAVSISLVLKCKNSEKAIKTIRSSGVEYVNKHKFILNKSMPCYYQS